MVIWVQDLVHASDAAPFGPSYSSNQ